MDETTATVRAVINPQAIQKLGSVLAARFVQYEADRRLAELKMARNTRQFLGIYDPDIEARLGADKSRAYPKLTRVKCVSMVSRLMNLLFQGTDKCWGVIASAVPDLEEQLLNAILQQVEQKALDTGAPPTDEQIEQAIREIAKTRAIRLELEIEDQLQELGGSRTEDFVALCRKVIMSAVQYGMGVLKGPFVETQKQRKWVRNAEGKLVAETYDAQRPRFEFVPWWDYYPDMGAKSLRHMDGQFQRVVMTKEQVSLLRDRDDFLADQLARAMQLFPSGNYKRRTYETELKAMGVQLNVTDAERGKYEAVVWDGGLSGQELRDVGALVAEADLGRVVRATVWIFGDVVVKAAVNEWVTLAGEADAPQMYHHFIFEEDESTIIGNALPNIMRDSQMGVCAGTRMTLDNGSIACGLNMEVNTSLLSLNQDVSSVQPNKIWYREDDSPTTMAYPAVKAIEIPSRIVELKAIVDMFRSNADQETFIGPATGGDMQKGPSEPFRTAAGASMIRGDAALPFKDVVRNFDAFMLSVVSALILFNKQFNPNPALRGDFTPVARGATSLLAKEVLGMQLDNLAATLTDEEKMFVNMRELLRARIRVRDLDHTDIVVDDAEADRREAAAQAAQAAQTETSKRMMEAQIREILADTLKALSQAGKNNAASEAATANVILNALEKGISPNALAQQTEGAGAADPSTGAQEGTGDAGVVAADPAQAGQGMPVGLLDGAGGGAAPVAGPSEGAGFAVNPNQQAA